MELYCLYSNRDDSHKEKSPRSMLGSRVLKMQNVGDELHMAQEATGEQMMFQPCQRTFMVYILLRHAQAPGLCRHSFNGGSRVEPGAGNPSLWKYR